MAYTCGQIVGTKCSPKVNEINKMSNYQWLKMWKKRKGDKLEMENLKDTNTSSYVMKKGWRSGEIKRNQRE
eukprot:12601591-Ditylum_brightwellii.AAC.1